MSNQYELPKLPKSAKRLIAVLSEKGQLTQKELIEFVGMPAKTVRYGLKRLGELELVVTKPNLQDMRSNFYSLNPDVNYNYMQKYIKEAKALVRKERQNN